MLKIWGPNVVDWKAVSQFPRHMQKPRPAEHVIQPAPGLRSQRVGGCYATHHPSCWVWPTATVWSLLMNFNRPFLYTIIRCTSHITNLIFVLGEFLSGHPPRSLKVSLCRNVFHQICSVIYLRPLLSFTHIFPTGGKLTVCCCYSLAGINVLFWDYLLWLPIFVLNIETCFTFKTTGLAFSHCYTSA